MKHFGMLDSTVDPLVPGGLTKKQQEELRRKGWGEETTRYDVRNVGIGFSSPDLPGGVIFKLVDVPAGTRYMYNPEDGTAIIMDCGNPSCWRYLLR